MFVHHLVKLGMSIARAHSGATRVVALITGANRGLGFTLAQMLVRRGGFHVIAAARKWTSEAGSSQNILQAAYREASKMPSRHIGGLDFVELDVTSDASRYALEGNLASVLGTEQRLNVLVNNAGIHLNEWTEEAFNKSMLTNCIAPLKLAEELLPFYAPDAHVVNVSSDKGRLSWSSQEYAAKIAAAKSITDLQTLKFDSGDKKMASEQVAPYKVSKAAFNRGTQILAEKYKGKVRFTALEPGWCKTDMYVCIHSSFAVISHKTNLFLM